MPCAVCRGVSPAPFLTSWSFLTGNSDLTKLLRALQERKQRSSEPHMQQVPNKEQLPQLPLATSLSYRGMAVIISPPGHIAPIHERCWAGLEGCIHLDCPLKTPPRHQVSAFLFRWQSCHVESDTSTWVVPRGTVHIPVNASGQAAAKANQTL